MALLELRGIAKSFGATAALSGVDLATDAGEVLALIGENGAGKSTLLNILSGTISPDAGEMFFAGRRYSPRGPADARALGIAHIHQELSLCAHLSVFENISLGLEPAHMGWLDRGAMDARARELLQDFGCEHIGVGAVAGSLSIPDQQVVEICRALASKARVILMDEPTSSLTRSSVDRLFRLIERLRAQGIAIIYISHFLEEVREVAARFTVLRDGKSVASGELASVTDDRLVAHMIGRETDLETMFAHTRIARLPGDALLRVKDLSSPPRLRSASFELHRGEVLGIGGLVGSGRTELVRALFGLAPSTGGIELHGRMVKAGFVASDQIRNGVGYLSEDRKHEGLFLQLSVADNLTMSAPGRTSRRGWIESEKRNDASARAITALSIRSAEPSAPVLRLSGGNQQKVAFARLLHQDPDILLLDEPTRGIDIRSKSDIYRQIRALADSGKAVLMVSSYLPELMGVCDRIAVMTRGTLSPTRDAAGWTAHSIMETAIGDPAAATGARP